MEEMEEMSSVYKKLLEQITLYNQYKNNIDFEKARKLSEIIVNINNLAIKLGLFEGDAESELTEMQTKLEYKDKNRTILFV